MSALYTACVAKTTLVYKHVATSDVCFVKCTLDLHVETNLIKTQVLSI